VSNRLSSLLLLAAMLLALLPLRLAFLAGPGPYGVDASYYYQIARHVAEGDGLTTSVSIFHEGAVRLPAPTRVYPLWPFLLGVAGSAIGLQPATQILPPLFYFTDLILLYFLANAIATRIRGAEQQTIVTIGHLAVAVFGTNRRFFEATAHPYTEGLAFACAFASLLLLARRREAWWIDALSGTAAACAFLARSQMAAFAAGVGVVLLYRAVRRREVRRLMIWSAGAAAPVAIWYAYLARHFPLSALNPFAGIAPFFKYSEVPALEPFVWWIPKDTVTGWIADRAPGVLVAFDPTSPFSYFVSFGAVAAVGPLALAVLIAGVIRRRGWGNATDPVVAAAVAGGLASNLVLLQFHAWHFLPWLFGWRHGLPYILLVTAAAAYLLTIDSRWIRGLVIALAAVSVMTGTLHCLRDAVEPRRVPSPAERAFMRWVASHPKTPTILTSQAQLLGMMTRAHYHWTHCRDSKEQIRRMIEHLPIDYVVVYGREVRCPFTRDLIAVAEPHIRFGPPGDAIYVLRARRKNTTGG
jgi:hypothetical protein